MTFFSGALFGEHSKLIMDPVHGGIPLLHHEVSVVDHPLFQRLRGICQNDILSLVFPGATHSRFLHSIGVMHVGDRIFRALVEGYLQRNLYFQEHSSTHHYETDQPNSDLFLEAIDYFLKIVRLACLLHDSGHSSFSHQFYKTLKIQQLMESTDRFLNLWKGININNLYQTIPTCIEHEHYSVRCAWDILDKCDIESAGINRQDVLGIMETTSVTFSDLFLNHAFNFWQFIAGVKIQIPNCLTTKQIGEMMASLLSSIVSGEVDADRADYMLRDGFHSSVTIGGFNLDHLLSNLRFGWDLEKPWLGMAITQKGLGALEDFVFSRYQMYRQVYAHKTALGFDWLLREAINEVMDKKETYDYVDNCLSNINEFGQLTDSFFWEQFREYARCHPKSYSKCIIDRVKLHHIVTLEDLSESQIFDYKRKYATLLSIPEAQVVTCSMKARFSKISDQFTTLKVLIREPITHKKSLKNITEVSSFFKKFSDGTIIHFYKKPF
jgi:HD superfamily phosphohydrolase